MKWGIFANKERTLTARFQPDDGYWRITRPEPSKNYDICFATTGERHAIPEPERFAWGRIGKAREVVKDSFWVWFEHFDDSIGIDVVQSPSQF